MNVTVKQFRADIEFPAGAGAKSVASTEGKLVYAIGDVHGQADLLVPLMSEILREIKQVHGREAIIIFLGDYIDRGPMSRNVVDIVLKLNDVPFVRLICLCGNHEDMLLKFLKDSGEAAPWLASGGIETLLSYGVEARDARNAPELFESLREKLLSAMPEGHLEFYKDLKMMAQVGNFAFVHAGVRPGVPLELQAEADLLWIRRPFLESKAPADKIIIHGHTPVMEPELFAHRIGIDTGAYATGVLTALKLNEGYIDIIQARRNASNV